MKFFIRTFVVGLMLSLFVGAVGAINLPALHVTPAAAQTPPIVHGIRLSWVPVSGITGYTIFRSTIAGGPYVIVSPPNFNATIFVDPISGLTRGTTYFYIVRVIDLFGVEGPNSNEVSVTVPVAPGMVTGLTATIQ
jgi:hypothetical protein